MKEPSARIFRWKTLLNEYDFDIEYIKGKENKVADFLSRIKTTRPQTDSEEIEIMSLFENSIDTVHSADEDANDYFQISDFIVNKYLTQIRIVKDKEKEYEKLYNKYHIIYVAEKDLIKNSYLTDLFRKYIKKGKIGIYSELEIAKYNLVQEKLIDLFSNDNKISFTKCNRMAKDVLEREEIFELIEKTHLSNNHRGVDENFEQMKWQYFYPNLKLLINKFINICRVCNENKYERNPFKKLFNHTETPGKPNEIVHIDVFYISKQMFLTSIDRFTKMATAHKLSDRNMCTVIIKLQERFSWLGKPQKLVMDNEFNNSLIRMFGQENGITMHFCTPNSHTGNSDIERLHSTIIEHSRIIKNSNENLDTEEIVIKAIGFYNNTIHQTTKLKPIDFLNRGDINYEEIKNRMSKTKRKNIERVNKKRDKVTGLYDEKNLFLKNPKASRNKMAKRFTKITKSYPNKIDLNQIKRPSKIM